MWQRLGDKRPGEQLMMGQKTWGWEHLEPLTITSGISTITLPIYIPQQLLNLPLSTTPTALSTISVPVSTITTAISTVTVPVYLS